MTSMNKERCATRYYKLRAEKKCSQCGGSLDTARVLCKLCREARLKYAKDLRASLKAVLFDRYGNKCARCGFEDPRALQIDHIDGGGCKERRRLGYGSNHSSLNYLKHLVRNTKGRYQLLCANCNWIKRVEGADKGESRIILP